MSTAAEFLVRCVRSLAVWVVVLASCWWFDRRRSFLFLLLAVPATPHVPDLSGHWVCRVNGVATFDVTIGNGGETVWWPRGIADPKEHQKCYGKIAWHELAQVWLETYTDRGSIDQPKSWIYHPWPRPEMLVSSDERWVLVRERR